MADLTNEELYAKKLAAAAAEKLHIQPPTVSIEGDDVVFKSDNAEELQTFKDALKQARSDAGLTSDPGKTPGHLNVIDDHNGVSIPKKQLSGLSEPQATKLHETLAGHPVAQPPAPAHDTPPTEDAAGQMSFDKGSDQVAAANPYNASLAQNIKARIDRGEKVEIAIEGKADKAGFRGKSARESHKLNEALASRRADNEGAALLAELKNIGVPEDVIRDSITLNKHGITDQGIRSSSVKIHSQATPGT
jgi:hypothetical protein